MSIGYWVVAGWAALAALGWIVAYVGGARALASLPRLGAVTPPEPSPFPRLSIVIPACNEAATIEPAIATLLAQDHPNLEIVVVDDRSNDGTTEIVDRVAASDSRVVAIHVTELPDGWLGKVHALDVGTQRATGDFVLFTDADVHYAPGTIRKAHALVVDRQIDSLVLLPQLEASSFLHEAVIDGFGSMFLQSVKPERAADPASEHYIGGGAFNLVRRSVLGRSAGFEHIRMEVADDMGLGLVLKRAGARQELWLAAREVKVLWYPSIAAMARGLEKNMFGIIGHYRAWRAVLRIAAVLLFVVGPFVGLAHSPFTAIASALAFASLFAFALVTRARIDGHRVLPALLTPVGQLVMLYFAARSTWVCTRNGAIEWRGTRYALARLAELQRVKV